MLQGIDDLSARSAVEAANTVLPVQFPIGKDRMLIPSAPDLERRQLTIVSEFLEQNPRRKLTHGWLAFEVLRRAPGGALKFEEYVSRLFRPDPEIRRLAEAIPGQKNAYQNLKHIRCDIYRRTVRVDPPLPEEWFKIHRCSGGERPNRG